MTHAPERNYRFVYLSHPDHLATGSATLAAVYPDARNAFAFPRVELDLPPWAVPEVWLFGGPTDDRRSTSPTSSRPRSGPAPRTTARRRCSTARSRTSCATFLGRTAAEHGLPDGRLAEAYRVLDTR